jgi:hypothetical protein
MSKKTAGQILLEKLENEAAQINQAMIDAEIADKAKRVAGVVAHAVEDIAEDVAEEIVDDSNLLMRKVKAFLPSRSTALHAFKIIAYWELAKLVLEFVL